jgi:hypothetical protein
MIISQSCRHISLAAVTAAVVLIIGCGGTKLADIQNELEKFKDKQVTLSGKVSETLALPFVHKGAYQLDDGTGKIWVVPAGDVPARGEKVKVTGTVRVGVEIAGKSFGTVLMEGK